MKGGVPLVSLSVTLVFIYENAIDFLIDKDLNFKLQVFKFVFIESALSFFSFHLHNSLEGEIWGGKKIVL